MTKHIVWVIALVLLISGGMAVAEMKGVLKINGKAVTLNHVVAYSRPDSFKKGAIDIVVVLTDKPLPKGRLAPPDGVQGISMTIEENGRVRSMQAYHDALGDMYWSLTNGTPIKFESRERTHKRISGRAHVPNAPEKFPGITLDRFDATFSTDVLDPETLMKKMAD